MDSASSSSTSSSSSEESNTITINGKTMTKIQYKQRKMRRRKRATIKHIRVINSAAETIETMLSVENEFNPSIQLIEMIHVFRTFINVFGIYTSAELQNEIEKAQLIADPEAMKSLNNIKIIAKSLDASLLRLKKMGVDSITAPKTCC